MENVEQSLAEIRAERDPNRRNLLTAILVSVAFHEIGLDPVIVGGSAIEIYTEGKYVSGHVDVCFAGPAIPTPEQRAAVMLPIGCPLVAQALDSRRWVVGGVLVEILGAVETVARTDFQQIGPVKVIQIEDLIAHRIHVATYPQPNSEQAEAARILLAMALRGAVTADLEELERVAASPNYDVGNELRHLRETLD